MLTKRELELVKTYAKIVSRTFSFPFDWHNNQLHPMKSKARKAVVYVNFIFSLIYLIFILVRFNAKYGGITTISMPFHAFSTICHCIYFFFHVHCFIYNEEMSTLFNQLVVFNRLNGLKHFEMSYLVPNIRERVIAVLHRWINCTAFSIAVSFLVMPNNTHYIYSLIPKSHKSIWLLLIFFVLESAIAMKIMIFHLFIILYGFFYIVSTKFWVKTVCIEWSTVESASKADDALQIFRCLTILNTLYNKAMSSMLIPAFKTLIEICVVICAYATIRLYGRIPFSAYILLPSLASFLFIEHQFAVARMAKLHELSQQIRWRYHLQLAACESVKRRRYLDQMLKSCRPLRCQLTRAIFVEKSTKLVLLSMMFNMLTSLLMTVGLNNSDADKNID